MEEENNLIIGEYLNRKRNDKKKNIKIILMVINQVNI